MAEYISKDQILQFKTNLYDTSGHLMYAVPTGNILKIKPTDVAPVRHGRWIMSSDRPDTIICNCCDSAFDVWKADIKRHHYCPNCGAKMDGRGRSSEESD